MQSVLKNKYVLYAVSALAVLNVLGYLSIGSMECLGVFAVTALVCQQYNKNMTICLLAAIFAANVIFGCGRIKENFAGKCGCGKKGCSGKENFTEGAGEDDSDELSQKIKEVALKALGVECQDDAGCETGKCAAAANETVKKCIAAVGEATGSEKAVNETLKNLANM